MELRGSRDLELTRRLYADHPLLGEVVARSGGSYASEFHMTNAERKGRFVPRGRLDQIGLLTDSDDTRDPRVRARLRAAGYVPLYEGKSFWLHDPYFAGARAKGSVSRFVALETLRHCLDTDAWTRARVVFRDITHSSTNQRTLITAVMPPAAHGNQAPTLDGLSAEVALALAAVLGSLVMDYIVRMKVHVHVNWFYAETLPIPPTVGTPFGESGADIVARLNAVGADFDVPASDPIVDPANRLAGRLVLDALTADLFGLTIEDMRHVSAQFPKYDVSAPDQYRYTELACRVYETFHADGPDAAEQRAEELAAARAVAGVGFGFDELWQPVGGWARANAEAREILAAEVSV